MNAVNDQERDIDNPSNPYGNYVPDPDSSWSCEQLEQWRSFALGLKAAHATQGGSTTIRDNYVNGYTKKIALYDSVITQKACAVTVLPGGSGESAGPPPATPVSPPAATASGSGFLSGVIDWVRNNPLLAGGIAAGIYLLISDHNKKS